MSMLKKILCIVLVVAIIGSAVAFIVYDKVGRKFDYEGKDMAKYLGLTLTKDQIDALAKTLDYSKVEGYEEIKDGDTRIGYKIAAAVAGITATDKASLEGGKLSNYDELTFLYYITLKDENGKETVVSNPAHMNYSSTSKPAFQLGEDPVDETSPLYPELSGMLSASLVGKDYDLFNVVTAGRVEEDDVIWVSYKIREVEKKEDGTDGTTRKTVEYKFQKTTLAEMNSLPHGDYDFSEVVNKFKAAQAAAEKDLAANKLPSVIGTKQTLDLGKNASGNNVYVDMTVNFASRTIVNEGDMKEGDTVYFTYKEKNASATNQMKVVIVKDGEESILKDQIGTGDAFYTEFKKLKLDADSKEIKVGDKTYVVSVDYAIPADKTAEREGLIKADPYVTGSAIEVKFPDDSKAEQYDATGALVKDATDSAKNVSLAGKTAYVYFYVVSGKHVDMTDFATYYTKLKFTGGDDEKLTAYLSAVKALKDYTGTDETKKKELNDAIDKAAKAYSPDKAVVAEEVIKTEYEKSIKKQVQTEVNNERAYGIAGVVWNNLLTQAKTSLKKYPSSAVRLAKKGILDAHESTYYAKKDTTYKDYKNFNDYLTRSVYKNQDKDDAVEAEAKQIVLETMLCHYLADAYGVSLTEEQQENLKSMESLYKQLGLTYDADNAETAQLFDTTMRKIAETYDYDERVKLPE